MKILKTRKKWEEILSDPFSDIDNEVTIDKLESLFYKYKKLILILAAFILVISITIFYIDYNKKSKDIRSYHINSDKIKKILNFKPKRKIEHAILEMCKAYELGKIPNSFSDVNYFNVKKLKLLKVKWKKHI